MNKKWRVIPCNFLELNLNVSLGGGQSFRWHKNNSDDWQGVLAGYVWSLKQDVDGNLLYHVHNFANYEVLPATNSKVKKPKISLKATAKDIQTNDEQHEDILRDYFRLNFSLEELYTSWSSADARFKDVSKDFPGVRILRQEPLENLISFICSANNNIPRITSMVEKLCIHFGDELWHDKSEKFYSFPSVASLADDTVEGKLRSLAFGYRAKYINQCAKALQKEPLGWLESLRRVPYEEAHASLVKLPGVGAKVADCVCLMSLDKLEAVPVDTHIWQVTKRNYMPQLKEAKSLTGTFYQQIGNFYRERFGELAGWANTVLFAADLKQFKKSPQKKQS